MNVLIVNTSLWGGGAEKVSRQLYAGLNGHNDINCFFLAGRESKRIQADMTVYHSGSISQAINHICYYIKKGQRDRDWYTTKMIIKIIHKRKIDIVHFNNIHGNYMGIKDIGKISKHCKIVWTLHDMWAITGHCAYSYQCDKWMEDSCKGCNNLQLYPAIDADIAKHAYKIKKKTFTNKNIYFVVPSNWLMEQCRQSFLAEEYKALIYNGVDTDLFHPIDKVGLREAYGIAQDKLVLLFSANDTGSLYKGVEILEEALCKVENKEEYELIIVGNAKKSSFSKDYTCHYMGYIQSDEKMNELYNLSDVLVIPSRSENFPCTVIESMAAGTPVIGSNVGGISEQIDENTGWLFDMGNARQLAEIITRLFDDKNKLHRMGINCRKKVEKLFSEEKMLEEYQKLYSNIMSTTDESKIEEKKNSCLRK